MFGLHLGRNEMYREKQIKNAKIGSGPQLIDLREKIEDLPRDTVPLNTMLECKR
jgi:hypothetical protein